MEDELIELGLLRDEEIDRLVEHGLRAQEDRWNVECRKGLTLDFPEMISVIVTSS